MAICLVIQAVTRAPPEPHPFTFSSVYFESISLRAPASCSPTHLQPPSLPRFLPTRYEHYLPNEKDQKSSEGATGGKTDSFTQMLFSLKHNLKDLTEKAEEVKSETNRAAIATANAEIRRGKNYLRGELPKLRKLLAKKNKGLSEEEKAARADEVDEFEYKIECIPDGVTRSVPPLPQKRVGTAGASGLGGGRNHVTIDVKNLTNNPTFNMEHSDASRAFRDEFEEAKQRQDQGLDEIAKGLNVLKNLGGEMDEEIKRQTPILDVIDDKLDSTNSQLRTANGKLKHVITQMRSTRNFCIDITLIFIILGIGLYLYNTFA